MFALMGDAFILVPYGKSSRSISFVSLPYSHSFIKWSKHLHKKQRFPNLSCLNKIFFIIFSPNFRVIPLFSGSYIHSYSYSERFSHNTFIALIPFDKIPHRFANSFCHLFCPKTHQKIINPNPKWQWLRSISQGFSPIFIKLRTTNLLYKYHDPPSSTSAQSFSFRNLKCKGSFLLLWFLYPDAPSKFALLLPWKPCCWKIPELESSLPAMPNFFHVLPPHHSPLKLQSKPSPRL